jgi:hypothetical protein
MDQNVKLRTAVAAFLAITVFACTDQPEQRTPDADASVHDSVPAPAPVTDTVVAPDTTGALTSDGWRDLRIGMTRAEVVAAAGEDANPEAVGGPDPASCDLFRPVRTPKGLLVMITNGRLSHITITGDTGIQTDAGFGVGAPASAIKTAYGSRAVATPHEYQGAPAEYIAVWTTDKTRPDARGIVYEIDAKGRVVRINAGDKTIENVEGCV